MLVLDRYERQEVVLTMSDGRIIRVVYLGMDRYGKARLGFEAPLDVAIDRAEVLRKRPEEEIEDRYE